jgi:hypothetical protein
MHWKDPKTACIKRYRNGFIYQLNTLKYPETDLNQDISLVFLKQGSLKFRTAMQSVCYWLVRLGTHYSELLNLNCVMLLVLKVKEMELRVSDCEVAELNNLWCLRIWSWECRCGNRIVCHACHSACRLIFLLLKFYEKQFHFLLDFFILISEFFLSLEFTLSSCSDLLTFDTSPSWLFPWLTILYFTEYLFFFPSM